MSNPHDTQPTRPSFINALDLPPSWKAVKVDLTNVDGNAFSILAHVCRQVKARSTHEHTAAVIERYKEAMMQYTYDEHLQLLMSDKFVNVEMNDLDSDEYEDEDETEDEDEGL